MPRIIEQPTTEDLPSMDDSTLCEQLFIGSNGEDIVIMMVDEAGSSYYGCLDYSEFVKTAQYVLNRRN